MTSDGSLSSKLRLIGDLERPDHWHLLPDDECYFFGDYTPRAGYSHSDANQLISNLKKGVQYRGQYAWRYKVRAIKKCGLAIAANLNKDLVPSTVIVPIPPSKPPDHPEFDDRMFKVAESAAPFAVAPLLTTNVARAPLHQSDERRDVDEIFEGLSLVPQHLGNATTCILVDDVITTGATYQACKRKLGEIEQFQNFLGIFIARCARPAIEFPDLEG